jgi:hypothetical protein
VGKGLTRKIKQEEKKGGLTVIRKKKRDRDLDCGLSEAGYDKIIEWASSILLEENKPKENFYTIRSMMKPLGLGYQKIDMCHNFCMLCYLEMLS